MVTIRACCFWRVYILQGFLVGLSYGVKNGGPAVDMRRTRKEVTTSLGQKVNLGCYATSPNSSSFTYSWIKDNVTITHSSNIEVYGNVLVITPGKSEDFGTYECHISNGRTSTICSISLRVGCNNTDSAFGGVATGCVNLSVLMPVLAVMMVSLLWNVHFFIQWRRRQQWLLSEEDVLRLQLAQESFEVDATEQLEEEVDISKNETCCGGFRKRRKEKEDVKQRIVENDKHHPKDQKNSDVIEMQENLDSSDTQEGLHTQDIPKVQDTPPRSETSPDKEIPRLEDILSQPEISPIAKHSPRILDLGEDSPRTSDSPREKEIPRLEDILSQPERSPIAKDRLESLQDNPRTLGSLRDSPRTFDDELADDSPCALESPGVKEIPRLEDFFRVEETSSDVRDSPRASHIPRTQEVPRLEEFFWDTETRDDDVSARNHSDAKRRSGEVQAPRIADFFLPGDESDAERQSLGSEEPLVSHYMEKMDFERGSEDGERDEEAQVSHYMEKMHFEEGNDDDGRK